MIRIRVKVENRCPLQVEDLGDDQVGNSEGTNDQGNVQQVAPDDAALDQGIEPDHRISEDESSDAHSRIAGKAGDVQLKPHAEAIVQPCQAGQDDGGKQGSEERLHLPPSPSASLSRTNSQGHRKATDQPTRA